MITKETTTRLHSKIRRPRLGRSVSVSNSNFARAPKVAKTPRAGTKRATPKKVTTPAAKSGKRCLEKRAARCVVPAKDALKRSAAKSLTGGGDGCSAIMRCSLAANPAGEQTAERNRYHRRPPRPTRCLRSI